jgi:sulfate adenylyltransferase subunit 2
MESDVVDVDGIVADLEATNMSERAGRMIDGDGGASMEAKKVEGYF